MKQLISGPVQYVAGRDVVVVQQVVPSCLSAEELQLVLAHRAERARQWAQMGAQDASIEIQEG